MLDSFFCFMYSPVSMKRNANKVNFLNNNIGAAAAVPELRA